MDVQRLEIDDDPGYFEFTLHQKTARFDSIDTNNKLIDFSKEAGENTELYHQRIGELLKDKLKLETAPSAAVAIKFADWVFAQAEAVRKKLDGLLSSPTTTPASGTPSSSTAGTEQP